jgi:hypothetical protein
MHPRSIYRIIELSTGWHGRIIETEVYFNVLDGAIQSLLPSPCGTYGI